MAMTKTSMKTKIKAAYNARTTLNMTEGDFNAIIDICQGIIEEMVANAIIDTTVTVTTTTTIPSGSSAGTYPGTGTGTGTGGITS